MSAANRPINWPALICIVVLAALNVLNLVNLHRKQEVIELQQSAIDRQNEALERSNASMLASIAAMRSQNEAIDRADAAMNAASDALKNCTSQLFIGRGNTSAITSVAPIASDIIEIDAVTLEPQP